jgi:hypothetical protein
MRDSLVIHTLIDELEICVTRRAVSEYFTTDTIFFILYFVIVDEYKRFSDIF